MVKFLSIWVIVLLIVLVVSWLTWITHGLLLIGAVGFFIITLIAVIVYLETT